MFRLPRSWFAGQRNPLPTEGLKPAMATVNFDSSRPLQAKITSELVRVGRWA